MTAVNVEVTRNNAENSTNLIRRFTRRLQGSGVLPRVRGVRYAKRGVSKFTRKKMALVRIERRAHFEELSKLGKAPVETKKKGRR